MIGTYIDAAPRGAVLSKLLPDGRVIDLLTSYTNPRLNISSNEHSMVYDSEY